MDKKDLRSKNLEILRMMLKKLRQATKPQLADASGLSVVTVNTLLRELLRNGEAAAVTEVSSSGGRPAQQYCFNAEHRLALAVYMYEKDGRDRMFISVENLLGNTLESAEAEPEKVTLEFFAEVLHPYIERYRQIEIIIAGLPGTEVRGRLAFSDYPELRDKPFCGWLTNKLKRPVYFENDINAAVAGYGFALGDCSLSETIAGIYFPRSYLPGAGVFQRRRLYKGRDGIAGEIGYCLAGFRRKKDRLRQAAQAVLIFAGIWNPHRIVLYDETLRPEQAADIEKICRKNLPAEFLPSLVIKESIYEDYGRGIRRLAAEYLNKNEK